VRTRAIQVEGTGTPAFDAVERVLLRDFEGSYVLDGTNVHFLSSGGLTLAFVVAPRVVGNTWTLDLRIDNVDRDYGAAAGVAETLARESGGRAVDPVLPDPLWPPFGGGPEHPIELVCEATWTFDDPQTLGPALLSAADQHWPSALPYAYSESEPFMCEAEPGDRAALERFLRPPTRAEKQGAWLGRRPALYGLVTWCSAQATLTLGILDEALKADGTGASRFFDALSRAAGSAPTTKSDRVTVEHGSWWKPES